MVRASVRSVILVALAGLLTATTMLSPATVHAQSASIVVRNYSFTPPTMTVTVGTTVTWTNRDTVSHTTTSDTGVWNSGAIMPGASFQHTFTSPGIFTYHCMIHPLMRGTIVVQNTGTQPGSRTTGLLTVTPNPVVVGSRATVQGAGFTPQSMIFVFWRRPDTTSRGVWTRSSPSGLFSVVLGFAPRHGIGTELVAAFDSVSRSWTPFALVSVVARGRGPGVLSALVNPVPNGGTTVIVGQVFTPGTIVVVQWRRPDGTGATVRVRASRSGTFAFRLRADPRHGCGVRPFTALDIATLLAGAPFSLGEIC